MTESGGTRFADPTARHKPRIIAEETFFVESQTKRTSELVLNERLASKSCVDSRDGLSAVATGDEPAAVGRIGEESFCGAREDSPGKWMNLRRTGSMTWRCQTRP